MTRGPDYQKDRSDRQIARILAAVADGPLTAKHLPRPADSVLRVVRAVVAEEGGRGRRHGRR